MISGQPPHNFLTLCLTLLFWLGCSAPLLAQPKPHPIKDAPQIQALCKHAKVMPAPSPVKKEGFPHAYLKARGENLQQVFYVDIDAKRFGTTEYERKTNLLTLVGQERYPLFDGSVALALRDAPLLAFEVPEEVAQRIEADCNAETVVLRLVFFLDALESPEKSYCDTNAEGLLTLQGRLMGARLFKAPRAGASISEPGVWTELAHLDSPTVQNVAEVVGLTTKSGKPAIKPQVETRVSALQGTWNPETLNRLKRDVTLLVLPCYLAALSHGGPERAVLAVEVRMGEGGRAKEVRVSVDAVGHKALVNCSTRVLHHLQAPEAKAKDGLRVHLFFERR